MECIALPDHLQALKDQLAAASTANHAAHTTLGTTITTVMGQTVPTPSADDLLDILRAANLLPAQSRSGNALQAGQQYDKEDILTKLSELLASQIKAETERLVQLAQTRVT